MNETLLNTHKIFRLNMIYNFINNADECARDLGDDEYVRVSTVKK